MKKPVPERSPCWSVPRTFTTALADLSKISLTSRLIEVVEGSGALDASAEGAGSWARAKVTQARKGTKNRKVITGKNNPRIGNRCFPGLKPESRFITHRRTIKHVTRRRRDPVSFGAVFDRANERRAKIAGRDRIGQAPGGILQRSRNGGSAILGRDIHRLGGLVNFQGNDRCTDQDCRHRGRIGSEPWKVQAEKEILGSLQANAPERFAQ